MFGKCSGLVIEETRLRMMEKCNGDVAMGWRQMMV